MNARKRTDTYPITFQLMANGAPIPDLAGSTVVLNLVNVATGEVKIAAGACVIVDPVTASCKYSPSAADVDTTGAYFLEVRQTRLDGTIRHFPSSSYEPLYIESNLGA